MPGHPYTGSSQTCCLPSSTVPPSTVFCGCSTSSTALIPRKVTILLQRVQSTGIAGVNKITVCEACGNLNGSYILRPTTNWWSTLCNYIWSGYINVGGDTAFHSTEVGIGCNSIPLIMLASLAITIGTTIAHWHVEFWEQGGGSVWDRRWCWNWNTRDQSPIPMPWGYACLGTTNSTYFYNTHIPTLGIPTSDRKPIRCGAAYDSTLLSGYSTLFPNITIMPSSSS